MPPHNGAEIKTTETVGPVLLHVVTEKGRGYLPAESASDKMHGVVQYDTVTGKQKSAPKSQVRAHVGAGACGGSERVPAERARAPCLRRAARPAQPPA